MLRLSHAELEELWDNATFVFDTNFLLDMYRMSHSTSEDFFKILEHLKERIWLPYQVGKEFFNRRESVIESEAASFDKALSYLKAWKEEQMKLSKLQGLLNNAGRIISAEVKSLFSTQDNYISAINEVEECFREKIVKLAETHSIPNVDEDNILEQILLLFDGKIGSPYSMVQLKSLHKEGEDRYNQQKPPGFKDDSKEEEKKYGDFLIWKQILDFAKNESRPIILITGDKKEDWWTKKSGEIVSPHLELRREFQEQVQQPIRFG